MFGFKLLTANVIYTSIISQMLPVLKAEFLNKSLTLFKEIRISIYKSLYVYMLSLQTMAVENVVLNTIALF